jgi:hypothetical protein
VSEPTLIGADTLPSGGAWEGSVQAKIMAATKKVARIIAGKD